MTHLWNAAAPSISIDPRGWAPSGQSNERREFEEFTVAGVPGVPRYLVTYMQSQIGGPIRSATIVSVTNRSARSNRVFVSYFRGFSDHTSPIGVTAFAIPPDSTVDFSSRNLPDELDVCHSICNPQLTFAEGRAIVSSTWPEIVVGSRVYYTAGDCDAKLLSIEDSTIVPFGQRHRGN